MPIQGAVVAFTHKTFGIGKQGSIPWNIPEDLKHFRKLTKGSIVIMGGNTFKSIGSRPLSERYNIVITKNSSGPMYHNLSYLNDTSKLNYDIDKTTTQYIIGGESLYAWGMGKVESIFATIIEKEFDCDTFFPMTDEYEIENFSERFYSDTEQCYYRYVTYIKSNSPSREKPYLDLLKDIMETGVERPDRTGVGTKAVFARQMRFSLDNGLVPVLTTKQLAWKTVLKELLWFLRGDCNSKNLEKEGVKIWKGNTSREFLDSRGLKNYKEGDMGPLYSHSLRHYGAKYYGCEADYTGKGYDQISELIKGLKEDPYSRRHVITTFNPAVVDECVLMPCHGIAIQFYVEDDIKLSCHVYCRSSDVFLGLSFNIASYAFLTHIIAQRVGMYAKELVISTGDTHIYKNHYEQVLEQMSRHCLPSPVFKIHSEPEKPFEYLTVNDFELVAYLHHPPIVAPMAL